MNSSINELQRVGGDKPISGKRILKSSRCVNALLFSVTLILIVPLEMQKLLIEPIFCSLLAFDPKIR